MINKYSAFDSDNPEIIKFASALRDSEIPCGYECYYQDDEGGVPFFKIPKAYKRENDGDPEFHYIYVDICKCKNGVGTEYRVTMVYTSQYVSKLDDCISLCEGLFAERFCEVALVTPIGLAGGFAIHRGSHEDNVKILIDDAQNIISNLQRLAEGAVLSSGNVQMMYQNGLLLDTICYRSADDFQYGGITVYAASYLCAYHPEIYVLQ